MNRSYGPRGLLTYEAVNTALGIETLTTPLYISAEYLSEVLDDQDPRKAEYIPAMCTFVHDCFENPGDDYHRQAVAEYYAAYQKAKAEADPVAGAAEADDQLADTIGFLQYYQHSIVETIEANDWLEKMDAWRLQCAEFIASPAGRRLVPPESTERVVGAMLSVPVLIDDPLLALYNDHQHQGDGYFGQFWGNSRVLRVDPFAIMSALSFDGQSDPWRVDIAVKNVLFHELIHACTNYFYRVVNGQSSGNAAIEFGQFWLRPWAEGMTQKLADQISTATATPYELAMLAAEAKGELGLSWDINSLWRHSEAPELPEALVNTSVGDIRSVYQSNYREFRLMLDAVFAKLDWQAAGYSAEDIETLAAYAFIETTEDVSAYRQQFITALTQASHPGFLMKLLHAVDMHGEELVTKLLLKPDFDPHDVQSVPFIATEDYRKYLNDQAQANQETWNMLLSWAIKGQRVLIQRSVATPTDLEADRQVQKMLGKDPRAVQQAQDVELATAQESIQLWLDISRE